LAFLGLLAEDGMIIICIQKGKEGREFIIYDCQFCLTDRGKRERASDETMMKSFGFGFLVSLDVGSSSRFQIQKKGEIMGVHPKRKSFSAEQNANQNVERSIVRRRKTFLDNGPW
jgi:hypothetical protein